MEPIGKLNAAIYRNLQSLINYQLSDIPILSGQSDFFFVVSKNEGISQKELSAHMFVNKSTTAKAIQNLVKNGFIRKVKDEHDKRVDRLYLTSAGQAIAPKIESIFAQNIAAAAGKLSAEEKQQLAVLLHKVLANLIDEKQNFTGEHDD